MMSQSIKKPPFVHYKLALRVGRRKQSSERKNVLKTWSEPSLITPDL